MKRFSCLLFFIAIAASVAVPQLSAVDVAQRDKEYAKLEEKLADFRMKLKQGIFPEIKHPVNDYADILSPAQEEAIATMLIDHKKKTGVQIAVLTVYTVNPMGIEEFSLKVAEKWGGGDSKRDDGLLFTVASLDHVMRLEVGYGLEGYVTDIKAGRILDAIRDDFKVNKYGQGIEKAVAQIIAATAECRPGEDPPASVRLMGVLSHIPGNFVVFFILGAVVAVGFLLVKWRLKFSLKVSVPVALFLYLAVPVLLQIFLSVFWVWIPVVYLTGALAGASIMGAIRVNAPKKSKKKKKIKHQDKPESRVSQVVGALLATLPAMGSLAAIYYFLHVQQPSQADTTKNETFCLVVLTMTNLIQGFIMIAVNGGFGSGESSDSYSSDTSSSSSGYSSSDSSNDTSWSGGGGGFGGGGASSSW